MKKYKCIQKYPHGPILGKEIHDSWEDESRSLANYPDFWEEIIDPAYKILKFHDGHNEYYKPLDGNNGEFTINLTYRYTEKDLLNRVNVSISSVKRMSDGKIFSLGDRVFYEYNTLIKWDIDNFLISLTEKNVLLVRSKDDQMVENLETLKKVDSVTFITEDGKELTEKDEFWVVTTDKKNLVGNRSHTFPSFSKDKTKYLRFSSLEAANDYRINSKNCLSLLDVTFNANINVDSASKLKELIKLKLEIK